MTIRRVTLSHTYSKKKEPCAFKLEKKEKFSIKLCLQMDNDRNDHRFSTYQFTTYPFLVKTSCFAKPAKSKMLLKVCWVNCCIVETLSA